jgi:hypothetical protein
MTRDDIISWQQYMATDHSTCPAVTRLLPSVRGPINTKPTHEEYLLF